MFKSKDAVDELKEYFSMAVSALIRTYPFVGSLLPKLRVVYMPNSDAIAAVDGTRIIIGRRFLGLRDEERIAVLAHEALHLGLQHPSRCSDKDPVICNIAADVVVNDMLRKEIRLPNGAITVDTLPLDAVRDVSRDEILQMNMEGIYELLMKKIANAWREFRFVPNIFPGYDINANHEQTCESSGGQGGQSRQHENKAVGKTQGKSESKESNEEPGAGSQSKDMKDNSKEQNSGGGDKAQDEEQQHGSGKGDKQRKGEGARDNKNSGNGGDEGNEELKEGEGGDEGTDYDGSYIINKGSKEIYGEGKTPTSEDAKDEIKRKLVDALMRSYLMAKMAGSVPGHIEAELGSLGRSVINWRQKLRRSLVSSLGSVVETWHKPNRRVDEYPGVKRLSLKDVWVLIDVSGSISMDEFRQFMTEVYEIARLYNAKVNIIEWDADVQKVVMNADKRYIPQVGRAGFGGTIIKPALKYVLEGNMLKYGSTVIIFSDWVLYDYGDPEVWRLLNKIAHTARLIEVTTYNNPIPIPTVTVIKIPIETITTQLISK
jgi:predicted metal-dependent peptidase